MTYSMKVVLANPPHILQTPTNPVAASSVRRHMVRPQRKERRVMKLIAQIPGWSLYDRLSPSGGWISLKLGVVQVLSAANGNPPASA